MALKSLTNFASSGGLGGSGGAPGAGDAGAPLQLNDGLFGSSGGLGGSAGTGGSGQWRRRLGFGRRGEWLARRHRWPWRGQRDSVVRRGRC